MGGVGEEGCRQTVGLTRLSRGPVRSLAQKEREASEVRLRYLGLGASCGPLEELERGEGVGLPLGCGDDSGEGGGGRSWEAGGAWSQEQTEGRGWGGGRRLMPLF